METTRLWNENLRNKKKFETHVNYNKYTILDPKVCRSCLRNLTDRSLILKGSTNHSLDEVSQFADQVSLYSECTEHCYQIKMETSLIAEKHVHWDNVVIEIEENFMRISHMQQ
ncbi:unnamed protein product [Brassica rapa]|uniref:Uncharacterized protein n=2 Tax=Brassica TaxID=3705 RepID=A0A8D9HDA1_BRACM|nr:unnamed protein product [Brassica napus]CAG7897524.1 unnamed protein product [Brassica rapa]